jgi:hypothetical protein
VTAALLPCLFNLQASYPSTFRSSCTLMFGFAIGSRNGSESVTDRPSLVKTMIIVTNPINPMMKIMMKRLVPAFGSLEPRLDPALELNKQTIHI